MQISKDDSAKLSKNFAFLWRMRVQDRPPFSKTLSPVLKKIDVYNMKRAHANFFDDNYKTISEHFNFLIKYTSIVP